MPTYRVVFLEPLGETPIRSISFDGDDAGQALLLAQNHDGPAELWLEGKRVCTLLRSGNYGELWVISNRDRKAGTPALDGTGAGSFMLGVAAEGNPGDGHPLPHHRRRGDEAIEQRSDSPGLV